jgi:hypothetical protein
MMMRINIKYATILQNIYTDNTGWNLYAPLNSNILFGKGNNDLWAQFYIIPKDNDYYILTYHSHTVKNINNEFGMYIGVSDNKIFTNMNKCEQSLWSITEIL